MGHASRPRLRHRRVPPRPDSPLRRSAPRDATPSRYSPNHHSPPPSSSRTLTRRDEPIYSAIEATPSPAITPPSPPRHPPRTPIKGEPPPRSIPNHSPSLSPSLPHRNTPPPSTDRRQSSLSAAVPFPHLPSSDEPTNVLTAASSTSLAPSPVTLSPGVAGGRAPVSSRGQPWRRSVVNRRHIWSTACGLSPQLFPHKNNSEFWKI
jgi:hypothetical protein